MHFLSLGLKLNDRPYICVVLFLALSGAMQCGGGNCIQCSYCNVADGTGRSLGWRHNKAKAFVIRRSDCSLKALSETEHTMDSKQLRPFSKQIWKAAKITIQLLGKYKGDECLADALKLDHNFQTPEKFLQEHFTKNNYSEEMQAAVTELFFKISKYKKYLKMIEGEFMSKKTGWPEEKSGESSLNLVLLYLLIIELSESSKQKITELVISLCEKKALLLLSFLKKPNTITKLYEIGTRIWDVEYVKDVLQYVIKNTAFEEVYETVTKRENNTKENRKKQPTVPVGPKCLSHPKKFVPPVEESFDCPPLLPVSRIPIMIRATPVPSSTYIRPNHLEKLEDVCRKHREEAKMKYEEAQKCAFRCANTDKSEKFKKISEEIEKERACAPLRKLSLVKVKPKMGKPPKMTAAVILREGARLLKLEQEEIKRYEYLASGGFNSDLLAEWEKEIREETFRKHIEDIEKKHLEGLLSYEEALIAKRKCLKKKKERASEFRKEKENWLNQLEAWKREEQIRIQESFERGKAYEKGAKEAVEHVKEEKHKIALETMEESRALKEKWLKEKEQDLQRKVQLIKEIKALQALGVVRKKHADFTETANLGFLYEMSLAELKERLFILKIEIQEELERRRAEVKMKRECRKEIIDSYQELIESHQKIVKEQKQEAEADIEYEEMKKKKKLMRTSSSLESLRRKLYEKRQERAREQILC